MLDKYIHFGSQRTRVFIVQSFKLSNMNEIFKSEKIAVSLSSHRCTVVSLLVTVLITVGDFSCCVIFSSITA